MPFCTNNQMKPKKGVDPLKIEKRQLNAKEPNFIVKAFHEAYIIACMSAFHKLQQLLLLFKADWA